MIRELVERDCAAFPLPNLVPVSARVFKSGPRFRLEDAALALRMNPDPLHAEVYVRALIDSTVRQVGSTLALHTTFKAAVDAIPAEVVEALPAHTVTALRELAKLTPVPVGDIRHQLAHALVVDGELVAWLSADRSEKKPSTVVDVDAELRRLAQRVHPDKGGDAEAMAIVNRVRAELRARR